MNAGERYTWKESTTAYELISPTIYDDKPSWNVRIYWRGHDGVYYLANGRVGSSYDPTAVYTGEGTVTEESLNMFCELNNAIQFA